MERFRENLAFEPDGEIEYFFDLTGGAKQPRALILQQNFRSENESSGTQKHNLITYSACWGYSGGGIQTDFLFKQDLTNSGLIYFTDCSGGEWHGCRKYSNQRSQWIEVQCDLSWEKNDYIAEEIIMSQWSKYFTLCKNECDVLLKPNLLNGARSTIIASDKFNYNFLQDASKIWNFRTLY